MSAITVHSHGRRREEPAGFTIDRPYGIGLFLLVRFHSPMEVQTQHGRLEGDAGSCVLFAPGHPQWYRGVGGAWVNDWMHLEGDVAALAAQHDIPCNTLLTPTDTRFFSRIFDEIAHEQFHAEANWELAVNLLVQQLFLKLGRALHEPAGQFSPSEAEYLPAFRALRRRVHESLAQHWTVGVMAADVGLSLSRFAALYQRFFGVSPMEDLLRARLQHAENLLTNRAMPVGEAAAQSGFRSLHYFSRAFHRRVGCAPSDYHRLRLKMRAPGR